MTEEDKEFQEFLNMFTTYLIQKVILSVLSYVLNYTNTQSRKQ